MSQHTTMPWPTRGSRRRGSPIAWKAAVGRMPVTNVLPLSASARAKNPRSWRRTMTCGVMTSRMGPMRPQRRSPARRSPSSRRQTVNIRSDTAARNASRTSQPRPTSQRRQQAQATSLTETTKTRQRERRPRLSASRRAHPQTPPTKLARSRHSPATPNGLHSMMPIGVRRLSVQQRSPRPPRPQRYRPDASGQGRPSPNRLPPKRILFRHPHAPVSRSRTITSTGVRHRPARRPNPPRAARQWRRPRTVRPRRTSFQRRA